MLRDLYRLSRENIGDEGLSSQNHQKFSLSEMVRGWFIGDFDPSVIRTPDFEVAVQNFSAGEKETKHVHKIATEVTVIVSGECTMNEVDYSSGDIVLISPGSPNQFSAITDVVTVVVKIPSLAGDKYLL